jgi:hypothetical protein
MSSKQFLTIAGRWKQHVAASGMDALPRGEQTRCMLMFYAGFSAALDANMEVAEFEEEDAMRLLTALHNEVQQIEAMATRMTGGRPLS